MPIDYARAKKNGSKLKSALTRALNQKDATERRKAVIAACTAAVKEWREWGAWPDNWRHWQCALDDTRIPFSNRVQLEDLD